MPLLDGLKVIRSPIHGYGVIALRPFKKGEVVVYGDGILYHEEDEWDDNYSLVYWDDEDEPGVITRYLDLTDQTRWINHACNPNTEVDTDINEETGEPHAWWVAIRDIKPGEELTYDYCFSGALAEPCNCGDPICLGLIVDPDEVDQVPKELQKKIKRDRIPARKAAMDYDI